MAPPVDELMTWAGALLKGAVLSGVGALIAVGQILSSREPITWRIALGRCLTSSGIALAAGAVLTWANVSDPLALVGVAAALSSLGTSGLERVVQRAIGIKGE